MYINVKILQKSINSKRQNCWFLRPSESVSIAAISLSDNFASAYIFGFLLIKETAINPRIAQQTAIQKKKVGTLLAISSE